MWRCTVGAQFSLFSAKMDSVCNKYVVFESWLPAAATVDLYVSMGCLDLEYNASELLPLG